MATLLVACVAAIGALAESGATAPDELADADGFVTAATPTAKFGTADWMLVSAAADTHAYIRFNVDALRAPIARATLRVYALSSSTAGFRVHTVSPRENWNEHMLHYKNAPRVGGVVASSGGVAPGWVEVDVTAPVANAVRVRDRAVVFALTSTSSTPIVLASRENGARAPRLTSSNDIVAPVVTLTTPPDNAITNDATPSLGGVAGTAAGDAATVTVRVYAGTAATGTALQTLSAVRGTGGDYTVDARTLVDGVYTAIAEQSDATGNVGRSGTTTFTIDTTAPSVTLATAALTNDPTPALTGRGGTGVGDGNVVVSLYSGSAATGTPIQQITATRAADGSFSVDAATLADGTYTAQAEQRDAVGNVGRSAPVTFTVDATAPAPTLTAAAATSDTTPALSGVAGTAPGDSSAVVVSVYGGTSASGSPLQTLNAARAATGAYSVDTATLPDGVYTAQAEQRDAAGNAGRSAPVTFQVDTLAPTVSLTSPPDATNDSTPPVAGTAGNGVGDPTTVRVQVFAGATATGTPTLVMDATRDAAGAFSVEPPAALVDGTYTARASQTDAAGNVGTSAARTFVVDTVAPAPTLTSPLSGTSTRQRQPALRGVAGIDAGDAPSVTIEVRDAAGTTVQTLTATPSVTGAFSAIPAVLAAGSYTARASQVDTAGNIGRSAPTSFTVVVLTYRGEVLADTPVGYWRLDETGGLVAADSSGHGLAGSYVGGVTLGAAGALLPTDTNEAAALDGADDLVSVPAAPLLEPGAGNFTIEAWVKVPTGAPFENVIASKQADTDHPYWELSVTDDSGRVGRARMEIWDGVNAAVFPRAYGPGILLNDGAWHHVAAVVDRVLGTTVYVDGVAGTTNTTPTPGPIANSAALRFGRGAIASHRPFVGSLDEVALYDRALSATRIRAHLDALLPPPPPPAGSPYADEVLADGATGFWRLGDAPASPSASDAGGLSLTGQYVGGVTRGVAGAIAGDPSTAARFDGSDDRVVVPDTDALDPGTSDFTLEAWIKSSVNGEQVIASKQVDQVAPYWEFTVTDDTGLAGRARAEIWDGATVLKAYGPNVRVDDGGWHHVAAVFDRDLGVRLWVDGIGGPLVAGLTPGLLQNTAALRIGEGPTSTHPHFAGDVDEFAFYRSAVPVSRLRTHFLVGAPVPVSADPTLLAVGDISTCANDGDDITSALVNRLPGTIVTLGDNVYESGSAAEFAGCFEPSWGVHRSRIRPAVGNHEYRTPGAAGYYSYFGSAAGDPTKGYYSFDEGTWHVIVLNTSGEEACEILSCAAGSAQEQWLRADLAAHPNACTVAVMHHPRFSSGSDHGSSPGVEPLWQALYDANADLVLAGHEHSYERFAPQTPGGAADGARGIREFVVGTGGKSFYPFNTALPNSEVRSTNVYGVLQLSLRAGSYDWRFAAPGGVSVDSGTGACH